MTLNEQLLPQRHLLLLGEVWDICIQEEAFSARTLSDILKCVRDSELSNWHIEKNAEGDLACAALEADLNYLHRRGFVFKDANPNPSVVPTTSAEFALKAAGML